MKTRLLFVRHAEAEGNSNRVFHGWTNSSITEKGHIQAKYLAQKLKNIDIDVIYSSGMKRTNQTGEYISKIKNLPIMYIHNLKEINGGDWEDQKFDDLPVKWPEEYETWENKPHLHQMPNGESMKEFQERLIKEVLYIKNNHLGKNICIVTHGTAIRALMCYFGGCDLVEIQKINWYENTSLTIIDCVDDAYNIILEGDASHLESDLTTLQNQSWWINFNQKLENKT